MTALATKYGKQRTLSPTQGDTNGFARASFRFRPGALIGRRAGSLLLETPLSASPRSDLTIIGCYEAQIECPAFTTADGDGAALNADGRRVALNGREGALGGFDTGTGANEITYADVSKGPIPCFAYDDNTLYKTDLGGTISFAGFACGVDPDGKIEMITNPTIRAMWRLTGAATLSASSAVPLNLLAFREVTSGGDVGNIAAIGGVLASDTTPILRADLAESQEIAWAAANVDPIGIQVALPPDFDGTAAATVDLWVYTDNTGGGGIDAATFTVETSWDGGALVSDAATDATPAITVHKVTATIAAADIPDAPSYLSLYLTPAAHANDPIQLVAARINYKPRLVTG